MDVEELRELVDVAVEKLLRTGTPQVFRVGSVEARLYPYEEDGVVCAYYYEVVGRDKKLKELIAKLIDEAFRKRGFISDSEINIALNN